jgi:putative flippase GtrA
MKFLLSGGINTVATYLLYLALLPSFGYRISYTVAYIAGVVLSFILNRRFVFKTHQGLRSVLLFPLVYVVQYLSNFFVVWAWVEVLKLPAILAPLAAICLTIPLTYILMRWVFQQRGDV